MMEQSVAKSATIDMLTPIWERVLKRKPIGAEDNFFDLGGDPESANRLFAKIARECGRDLSPLTIYQAPTIATLGAILEEPLMPRFPPVVRLKAGIKEPPIFMVPGTGGNVTEFFKLLKHIESEHSIYGMQARGMDGVQEPFERIEDLAKFYLDAVRALQPHGPYILVGYSLGGLVTLEMAQRLTENGEKIALLIMVETYPHWSLMPLGQKAAIAKRRSKRLVTKTLRRAGLLKRDAEDAENHAPDDFKVTGKFVSVIQRTSDAAGESLRRYRPQYYKGRVNFIRATTVEGKFADDPIAVWGKLAQEFVVDAVPGNHFGIVSRQFKSLAAVLSRYLKEMPNQD